MGSISSAAIDEEDYTEYTTQEVLSAQKEENIKTTSKDIAALFARYDKLGDGFLDAKEFASFSETAFHVLFPKAANGEQQIFKDGTLRKWERLYLRDGKVSLDEFRLCVDALCEFQYDTGRHYLHDVRGEEEPFPDWFLVRGEEEPFPDWFLDDYNRILFKQIGKAAIAAKQKHPQPPSPLIVQPPGPPNPKPDLITLFGIKMLRYDPIYENREPSLQQKIFLGLAGMFLGGPSTIDTWPSPTAARDALEAQFSSLLNSPSVRWSTNPRKFNLRLGLNMMQGCGAFLLESDQKGGYVVPLSKMAKYKVHPGYVPFGCNVFLNNDGEVTHIELPDGTAVRPGDGEWTKSCFLANSSAFAYMTVVQHAVYCHLIVSNTAALASSTVLPAKHPLRCLLHYVTYRSAFMNHFAAICLLTEGSIISRTALDDIGLQAMALEGLQDFAYESFPQSLSRKGLDLLPDSIYPTGSDGLHYWGILEQFVKEYLAVFYQTDQDIAADASLQSFWATMVDAFPSRSKPPAACSLSALTLYLTHTIFYVTAVHEHVGSITDFAFDPYFTAFGVRQDIYYAGPQLATMSMLLALLSVSKQPLIMADWSHLLPANGAKAALNSFIMRCAELSDAIVKKQKNRRQLYVLMDPRRFACSVSI
eukprot:g58691.t1